MEYPYFVFVYNFHDVVLTVLFVFAFVDVFTFAVLFVFTFVVAFVFPPGAIGPQVERQVHEPAAPMVVTPQIGW